MTSANVNLNDGTLEGLVHRNDILFFRSSTILRPLRDPMTPHTLFDRFIEYDGEAPREEMRTARGTCVLLCAAVSKKAEGMRRMPRLRVFTAAIMPRRSDIDKILIIGSGPIIIGQACEFDYSGTQACKALMEEGYRDGAGQQQSRHHHDRSRIRPTAPILSP